MKNCTSKCVGQCARYISFTATVRWPYLFFVYIHVHVRLTDWNILIWTWLFIRYELDSVTSTSSKGQCYQSLISTTYICTCTTQHTWYTQDLPVLRVPSKHSNAAEKDIWNIKKHHQINHYGVIKPTTLAHKLLLRKKNVSGLRWESNPQPSVWLFDEALEVDS